MNVNSWLTRGGNKAAEMWVVTLRLIQAVPTYPFVSHPYLCRRLSLSPAFWHSAFNDQSCISRTTN